MPHRQEPIAIVGLGGVFPGAATLDAFWELIASGRDCASEPPKGRWLRPVDELYDPRPATADKIVSKKACFVQHFELDRAGIGLGEEFLKNLDPVCHFALHAARDAVRSADLRGTDPGRIGVVFGNIALPTDGSSALAAETFEHRPLKTPLNRFVTGLPAGLVARALGLGGGAYTLDAACASSLYALKLACDELNAHRADAMLAGGVSRPDSLYTQMGFSQLRALSPNGICSPFDAKGNGLVVGEGAGLFVLKRLDDAFKNGDRVHGVIRGIGLSNDIEGSLLAPSAEGQLRAMRAAYEAAEWRPEQVELIECHATGTPLGDAVEASSLRALWGEAGWKPGQAVIGGVKSNVGHLLTAAGAAGLMKVLLAFKHKSLPPTAHFEKPAPGVDLESGPFRVLAEAEPWKSRGTRKAAVSGFGFGGINAHVLVEEYEPPRRGKRRVKRTARPPKSGGVPVAVVGIGAQFGPWDSRDALEERFFGSDGEKPRAPRWRGRSGESFRAYPIDAFDLPLGRFRVPPKELEQALPQQLLMLKTAAAAVDDAAWEDGPKLSTGVFIGLALDLNATNFHCRWRLPEEKRDAFGPALNADRTLGALGGIVASRVAREFRAGGASFTVQSEESSGLTALEAAVRALQSGALDQALVGAVDLACDARAVLGSDAARPYSKSGMARPFREDADGTIPGEGAAALALKRLDDALRDGDRVYAVVRGVGSASTPAGEAPVPASETVAEAMRRAYSDAAIDPRTVGLFEAHGSGAPAEDAAERAGIERFLDGRVPAWRISTTKDRIGHAGAASGLASFVKAALALHKEVLPGESASYWMRDRQSGPRRAAVSAFGIDGGCVHAVLEEAPTKPSGAGLRTPRARLFAARAESVEGLRAQLESLSPERAVGRGPRSLAVVAIDAVEARRSAAALLERAGREPERAHGRAGERALYRPAPLESGFKTAFVFPGLGNAFHGMGRDLALAWPEPLRRQDAENEFLASQYRAGIFWGERPEAFSPRDAIYGQVCLGAFTADLMRGFGLPCDQAVGLSLGESAALFALGAWKDRDEMLRRLEKSTLFTRELTGECRSARTRWKLPKGEPLEWVAAVVDASKDSVDAALKNRERVYRLIVNTPHETVIGGERGAVEALVREMGARSMPVDGATTLHCEAAEPVKDAYRELHLFPVEAPEGVSFYSGATGEAYAPNRESAADAILAQALGPVDFPKTVESAYRDGARLFIEMGPGASCTRMIGGILGDRVHEAAAVCPRGESAVSATLRALAAAFVSGKELDFAAVNGPFEQPRPERPAMRIPVEYRPDPAPSPAPVVSGRAPRPVPVASPASVAPAPVNWFVEARRKTADAHAAYMKFADAARTALVAVAVPGVERDPNAVPRALTKEQCFEIAMGKIGAVLGPSFAHADSYPTRVRLPDAPLQLVDRITLIEGEPHSMGSGRVVTEHDIESGAWYLDGGRIPVCIAVEAGQADLFLSGFLGVDAVTKGKAVYRLLDAEVSFHRPLPGPGSTIVYDIRILRFFRQGETHLFRFEFDATVDGELLLTMRKGVAGFFTQEELDGGKGIVHTRLDLREMPGKVTGGFAPLAPLVGVEIYDDARVDEIRRGRMFPELPLRDPVGLPDGRMKLIDRVTRFDPTGGRFGLGQLRAEADIHPDDWFLTCHFVDDQVMPGTLMYECCLHAFRTMLLRFGWVAEKDSVVYEPIPGAASVLKCRGQVIASTKTAAYEISLKEIGYQDDGTPYAIADALMFADGRPVVEMLNMSVRLSGTHKTDLERLWDRSEPAALFDDASITAFAIGKPSEAFGERYKIFDSERVIARLPGAPYKFLNRITRIEKARPWVLEAGAVIDAEYDVPSSEWYFDADRQPVMPFAVLLEAALQPCGWLAAYLGSALTSGEDLSFRNLGGEAVQLQAVTPGMGTLRTTVTLTGVSNSGGMIIQHYSYKMLCRQETVYEGTTYFGFFSKGALADQIGIRDAALYEPDAAETARARSFDVPREAPMPDDRWRMVERVTCFVPDGGPKGLGFIEGTAAVNPEAWFFKAHFHQDPVWPGSLGLESFLQLLKTVALERWGAAACARFESLALGEKHRWIYRGQILPADSQVTVQAVVTEIDEELRRIRADGFLSVDGRVIYQMVDFTIRAAGADA